MKTRTWSKTEPGTIVLEGTMMKIVYRPETRYFEIFQGEQSLGSSLALQIAKDSAEKTWDELVEIGVVEDSEK